MYDTNTFTIRRHVSISFSARAVASILVVLLAAFGCSRSMALDQAGAPGADAEKPSPQDAALQRIRVAYESVDVSDKDYASKRYELFKSLYTEHMRLKHSTVHEAASYANAMTNASGFYRRLSNEDPRMTENELGAAVVTKTPSSAGASPAINAEKLVIALSPAQEETLKSLAPQVAVLKRIQFEFESVDIQDRDYEAIRYALYCKYFNEHIRVNGSTPSEALNYTHAILGAGAFFKRVTSDDPRLNRSQIGNGSSDNVYLSDKTHRDAPKDPNNVTTPKAKVADTSITTRDNMKPVRPADKPAAPERTVDPMLTGWASVMRNYIKFKDLQGAKEYAKKIVDKFPGTPEADEAKGVLQMSAIGAVPDSKPAQPAAAPVNAAKAKGLASMMRNYVKAHQLDQAKQYAKKIVDGFPGTPEADEAKSVLELKD